MLFFYGNLDAYRTYLYNITGMLLPDAILWNIFVTQTNAEFYNLIVFSAGIIKSAFYPVTFLLQILCLIYLIRGNSGFSRSARNWFIMGVSADIASFLYLLYELLVQDWQRSNPFSDHSYLPGNIFMTLMWGLRNVNHADIQNVMCKTFFAIVYFPLYLSPISLTMSALLRSYSVKFPLRAKAVLTKCTDRVLMICAVMLSLAVSVIIAVIDTAGEYDLTRKANVLGEDVFVGYCRIPMAQLVGSSELLQAGYIFMMVFGFVISGLNMVSAVITVWVLFNSRKTRKSMSSSVGDKSNSELRATMKLLGINIMMLVCFFLSRLFILLQFVPKNPPVGSSYLAIIRPMIFERLGSYLFVIPYCTNWLFIVGFDKKFYLHFFGCIGKKSGSTSSMQLKTASATVPVEN